MKTKILIITLLVSACSTPIWFRYRDLKHEVKDYSKVATGKRVFDGDPEPVWPGSKNDDTLEGIDADHDGLRDDVEIWINEEMKDRNTRLAYKQYAKASLMYLNWEKTGISSKPIVYTKLVLPAFQCVKAVADNKDNILVMHYLDQMIEHGNDRTKKRRKDDVINSNAEWNAEVSKFQQLGDPYKMEIKEAAKWQMQFCNFEIENKQKYIDTPYFFEK